MLETDGCSGSCMKAGTRLQLQQQHKSHAWCTMRLPRTLLKLSGVTYLFSCLCGATAVSPVITLCATN
jgi:hypothetical protein